MRWKLFADLADITDARTVEIKLEEPVTVQEAFEALLESNPELRDRVINEDDQLYDRINLLLNGSNISTFDEKYEMTVMEDDELALFPPVSGG